LASTVDSLVAGTTAVVAALAVSTASRSCQTCFLLAV